MSLDFEKEFSTGTSNQGKENAMITIDAAISPIHKAVTSSSASHVLRESVAVLLPTYCEAENIGRLIQEIQALKLDAMITVIDDSSPDDTERIVKEFQKKSGNIRFISRKRKLGLGSAITAGFRFFLSLPNPPDFIITMDSDYSHNPKDIVRLVKNAKEGNDLVIGSRYVKGGFLKDWPLRRRMISRCANLIAALVIEKRVKDCTSGFRCYSRSFVEKVLPALHSTTYEIQIETIRQAKLSGFRIKEVPITFVNRKRGKSKLSKDEIFAFLTYTVKSWFGNPSIAEDA
jgi:dolichol-phosphate mannosyltransferase